MQLLLRLRHLRRRDALDLGAALGEITCGHLLALVARELRRHVRALAMLLQRRCAG